MVGVSVQFDTDGIRTEILPKLARIMDLDAEELLDAIGNIAVSQTQRRISSEKTAPDGTAWPANGRGGSILFLEGHLNSSIAHQVSGDEVAWGSDLIYAAIHQYGGEIKPKAGKSLSFRIGNQWINVGKVTMPQRQYLGLSEDNKDDIVEEINDHLRELLQ